MLWFDLGTPKSVLFFKPLIRRLQAMGEPPVLTSRGGRAYGEVAKLLRHHGLDAVMVGEHGGETLVGKLEAALARQAALLDLVRNQSIDGVISLGNPDSSRVAFGLGIPVYIFCDLPTARDGESPHPVARLSLPLARRILHPFVVPPALLSRYLGADRLIQYDFLDPVLYLREQIPDPSFMRTLDLTEGKPTVCFREEEHMAAYVDRTAPWVLDALRQLDADVLVIPRYSSDALRERLPSAVVIDDGRELSEVLPYVDVMVGGGGTINIEAAYWGTPVISTRSFLSQYDAFLVEHGLMWHARSAVEFAKLYARLVGQRSDPSVLREQVRRADVDALLERIVGPKARLAS